MWDVGLQTVLNPQRKFKVVERWALLCDIGYLIGFPWDKVR